MPTVEQYGHQGCDGCTTINQTINLGSYANSLLIVGVSINNSEFEFVDSLQWNGADLTRSGFDTTDDDGRVEIWYLTNPESGNYTLSCVFSEALKYQAIVGYLVVSGVDQDTPLGTFESLSEGSSPISIDVLSDEGDLVFGCACGETVDSFSPGTGQTDYWNDVVSSNTYAAGCTKDGEALTTEISYTLGNQDHTVLAGVAIKPAAAAGGGQPMSLRRKQVPFLRSW
ncbi:MAG: hypothetical protein CV087_20805 [Candidatus Brocadia sp. WS118]|nr:MAG: hypothetical protein CV087_20805 [Candidatus Brocadia sp. WS118]